MELQRTSSISGPLSPAYTGQVPYNYNQLEGRFKQLQGKSPAKGQACLGVLRKYPWCFLKLYFCHMVVTPVKIAATRPQVGCESLTEALKEALAYTTPDSSTATIWSFSSPIPFGSKL